MKRIIITVVSICLFAAGTACAATIQLPRTGQAACFDANGAVIACAGSGQDGDKLKGVVWPNPRFTDNANGTVTDNLTGLIWLKNANCFSLQTWVTALSSANTLANGTCGLSDGSTAGHWRLPNRKELMSLVDRSNFSPALPTGHPFTSVQSHFYWSGSTSTYLNDTSKAWFVHMGGGAVGSGDKGDGQSIWPVRGGQ